MSGFDANYREFGYHDREWKMAQCNRGVFGHPCGENVWYGGLSVRWGGELSVGDVIIIETVCDAPSGITLEHTGFFVREV
jgi:hypothetical protein